MNVKAPLPTVNFSSVADDGALEPNEVEASYLRHEVSQTASSTAGLADLSTQMLHTLGMLHELASPDRPNSIELLKDVIYTLYAAPPNGWTKEQTDKQVLEVYERSSLANFSQFE